MCPPSNNSVLIYWFTVYDSFLIFKTGNCLKVAKE